MTVSMIFGIDVEKGFYSMTEVPSSPSIIIPSKYRTQLHFAILHHSLQEYKLVSLFRQMLLAEHNHI